MDEFYELSKDGGGMPDFSKSLKTHYLCFRGALME